MVPTPTKYVKEYWLDFVGVVFLAAVYGWYMGSWKHFAIGLGVSVLGYMSVLWFGELIPFVGYFIRKWERNTKK